METLKKFKSSVYAVSIIYLIVGIIMLLNPSFVGSAVNYVLGVLVIIYGLIYSISVYQKREENYDKFDLLAGVICISFGIFLIINKDVLLSLIPFCMGIIFLMDAVTGIIKSLRLKKIGLTRWYIALIINLIFLAFAIYIIVKANAITELLIRFIGGFLIADALMDFFLSIRFNKKTEDVKTREITVVEEKDD